MRPMVVLPHPDSPTSPKVSPLRIVKLTPETALTEPTCRRKTPPAITGNSFTRSVTSIRGAPSGTPSAAAADGETPAGAWTSMTGSGASGSTGWKQAKRCGTVESPPSEVSSGSTARHSSVANWQRGAKRQPTMVCDRSGGSPGMESSRSSRRCSNFGTEARRAWL